MSEQTQHGFRPLAGLSCINHIDIFEDYAEE